MARPMQQQNQVVHAVLDRHGQPASEAIIQGKSYRLGDELVASLTEGLAILRGEVQPARFHPAPHLTKGAR